MKRELSGFAGCAHQGRKQKSKRRKITGAEKVLTSIVAWTAGNGWRSKLGEVEGYASPTIGTTGP